MANTVGKKVKSIILSLALAAAFLILAINQANAATVLNPGDLMIIAINCDIDDTYGQGFSFMTLVNLEAGTEIFFTDYGWSDNENSFITNTVMGDSFIKYTAPLEGVPAGTIIRCATNDFSPFTFHLTYGASTSAAYLNLDGSDEVLAFQGSITSPDFICAASYAATDVLTSGWATNVSSNGTNGNGAGSALPPGLADDVTALSFNQPVNANDNSAYNGPTGYANREEWLSRIADYSNWNINDMNPIPAPPAGLYAETINNISSAFVSGIAAPKAGAVPAVYTSLITGDDSYTVASLAWKNADDSSAVLVNGRFKAGGIYKAVIELKSAAGYRFPAEGMTPSVNVGMSSPGSVSGGDTEGKTLSFTVTFDAVAPLSVKSMAIVSQPMVLSYLEGQALDLNGLVVVLTYNDTSTKRIPSAKFAAKGIAAEPSQGTTLTIADHNAQAIKLHYNRHAVQTTPLTVIAATYTISTDPASKDFGSMIEGYAVPAVAHTVAITNTGNSPVTLSQPTGTDYAVGTLSAAALASGESAAFTVQPKAGLGAGLHNETIMINTDHGTSAVIELTVMVLPAVYSISSNTASKDFGSMIEGYAVPAVAHTVTITNTGNSPVTLSQPTGTDYTVGTLSTATLASGESAAFTVQPKAGLEAGPHNETITINTDHGTSAVIELTAMVLPAVYSISSNIASKDFGSIVKGHASIPDAQTVTITNDGNMPVTLVQPASVDYKVGTLSAATLASGESATFTIQPKDDLKTGPHNETITVNADHNAFANINAAFIVQPAGCVISADPAFVHFNYDIIEGYASAPSPRTVTVTNKCDSSVTLTQPAGTDYIIGALSSAALASGESATFTVQLKTGLEAGEHTETITVNTNHGTSASIEVSTFILYDPHAISVDPTGMDFTPMIEGYVTPPAAKTVTITNVAVSTITLYHKADDTIYTLGALSSATLAPGESATFTVQPKMGLKAGMNIDYISVSTNHSASVDIRTTFEVLPIIYDIWATTTMIGFGETAQGAPPPAAGTVEIENCGNQPVTLIQPTAVNYLVGALSALSIAPTERSSFTLQPKPGLAAGNYNETITIQGSNGTSCDMQVVFSVTDAVSP